jgi:hypothetical protein
MTEAATWPARPKSKPGPRVGMAAASPGAEVHAHWLQRQNQAPIKTVGLQVGFPRPRILRPTAAGLVKGAG